MVLTGAMSAKTINSDRSGEKERLESMREKRLRMKRNDSIRHLRFHIKDSTVHFKTQDSLSK